MESLLLIPILVNIFLLTLLAYQDKKQLWITNKAYYITLGLEGANIVFMLLYVFQIFFISLILSGLILYVLRKVLPRILKKTDIIVMALFLITSFIPSFIALALFFIFSSINSLKNKGKIYPALFRFLIFYLIGVVLCLII